MSNKTLRSVLAVAFSAGLALGVFAASDLTRGDAPHRAVEAWSQAPKPGDVVWDTAPAGQAAVRAEVTHLADGVRDFAPTETDRA
ncbi:hypothetical protein GCM10010298_12280 [Streptomyces microflavus]|uniref:Uncharacterized protein n=1 Tax=Streptomyces microflavus TaxID=1919 RepID=A0A7J0CT11_STRMI|nr:hypothetical protein Smic_36300 [Streptomyces microflavus]GGX50294.1 hypothetical protein GCM10010298_12280 [Streptomyces microflavus]